MSQGRTALTEAFEVADDDTTIDQKDLCRIGCALKRVVCDGKTPALCERVEAVLEENNCDPCEESGEGT